MTLPLFDPAPQPPEPLDDGAMLLRGFAAGQEQWWVAAVQAAVAQAPFRCMQTPRGAMSVAMSNCGDWGWVASAAGYGYRRTDPLSGQPWPVMPDFLRAQAVLAAETAGYAGFAPDACLINRYAVGAKMGLHRDEDEADRGAPIVSVSLGLPCTFLWGGLRRQDAVRRLLLQHGDVLVWGGATRLVHHGVNALKSGQHHLLGAERWNLTFRMARARYPRA
ncbi:DNA oxidative demethylase AlkB [Comamonas composti]|uniref:DNA oxidative demethylase AlkB n=1 Tax=Comamonas composti TaxID=408558 RepID=UPI0003F65AFF|nr:DNA oxidative demethylase AlkB [Comamonas composti]